MILVYIDIVLFFIFLYINYRKYKFSIDFNLKQDLGAATIFFIIVLFGITIPALTGVIVKFYLTSQFSEIYRSYAPIRFPMYWVLGVLQLVYLFVLNSKVKPRKV